MSDGPSTDGAGGRADVPLPDVNPSNRPYWEGARDERLVIQRCPECNRAVFPPRMACPECFAALEWVEAVGAGRVYTYGIVHRPNLPSVFEGSVPFTVAVVELVEGALVLANIVDCPPEDVSVDMPVRVTFDHVSDEATLPQFEPE